MTARQSSSHRLAKGRIQPWLLAASAIAMTVGGNAAAFATTINIADFLTNPSFEAGTSTLPSSLICPTGWTCNSSLAPGAASFLITSAQYIPGADGLPGGLVTPNGNYAAWLPAHAPGTPPDPLAGNGSVTLSQSIASLSYTTGNVYVLDFWLGAPLTQPDNVFPVASFPDTLRVSLLGPGNLCDQNTASLTKVGGATTSVTGSGGGCVFDLTGSWAPATGQWSEYVLTYTDTFNVTGNVGVSFFLSTDSIGQPSEVNLDIGPLPVPEPMTLTLFGAGLAGALATRRRKKR
jgi:hypothetical protein